MWLGRTDGGAVPGPRKDQVIGVLGEAGQLRRAFAAERRADGRSAGGGCPGRNDEGGLDRAWRQRPGGHPRPFIGASYNRPGGGSLTEPKLPRRIASRVRMLNHGSTWFIQDVDVGVK